MAESMFADTEQRENLAKTGNHEIAAELNVPSPGAHEYDSKLLDLLDCLIEDAHGIPRPDEGSSYNPPIVVFDDFNTGDQNWTATEGDGGGTNTYSTSNGTWTEVVTVDTDNDYRYMATEAAPFLISDLNQGDQLVFAARVDEGTQTGAEANYIVGLVDTVAGATIQDDGAGPCNTYDMLAFYKVDGCTDWVFNAAANGSCVANEATGTDSASIAEVGVVVTVGQDADGDVCSDKSKVEAYFNGSVLCTTEITNANADDAMHVVYGSKAGAGNAAGLCVDYIGAGQTRRKS